MPELKKSTEGLDVAYLYIIAFERDNDIDKWKNAVKKYNLTGYNTQDSRLSDLKGKVFDVTEDGVPLLVFPAIS